MIWESKKKIIRDRYFIKGVENFLESVKKEKTDNEISIYLYLIFIFVQ